MRRVFDSTSFQSGLIVVHNHARRRPTSALLRIRPTRRHRIRRRRVDDVLLVPRPQGGSWHHLLRSSAERDLYELVFIIVERTARFR